MAAMQYRHFSDVSAEEFAVLLNKPKIRAHLIEHPPFTVETVRQWVAGKIAMDNTRGCKVRAIFVGNTLAGWCGIQCEGSDDERACCELALVLDQAYWGQGRQVFKVLMAWARELGHHTVLIHFLHTRPVYPFLQKMASAVYQQTLLGAQFTTYELRVV